MVGLFDGNHKGRTLGCELVDMSNRRTTIPKSGDAMAIDHWV
jgi:hypothetical protein